MTDFDPAHTPDDGVLFQAVHLACGNLPERNQPDADYLNTFHDLVKAHYRDTFGILRKFEWSDFLSVKWTQYERWYAYHVSERHGHFRDAHRFSPEKNQKFHLTPQYAHRRIAPT